MLAHLRACRHVCHSRRRTGPELDADCQCRFRGQSLPKCNERLWPVRSVDCRTLILRSRRSKAIASKYPSNAAPLVFYRGRLVRLAKTFRRRESGCAAARQSAPHRSIGLRVELRSCVRNPLTNLRPCRSVAQAALSPCGSLEERHDLAGCPSCIPLNAEHAACRIPRHHDGDGHHNADHDRDRHMRRLAWA